jgi:hypothetical protein
LSTQTEIASVALTPSEIQSLKFPEAFFDAVIQQLPTLLKYQQEDGRIVYNPRQAFGSPQNAIFPMAFALTTGNSPLRNSNALRNSLRKLTQFLEKNTTAHGEIKLAEGAHVDQRLIYAWIETTRLLRDAKEDFPFDDWEKRIVGACEKLIDHRLKHGVGLKRLIGRVLGTSTNHFALYMAAVYRAGMVFGKPEYCDFVRPMAKALALDVHPDGYWEEHGDLTREIGPTICYGYLTHGGMSLLCEWTKEPAIKEALEKSAKFYSRFLYPDATYLDVMDERVRYHHWSRARSWGLFGFSHTSEGRGVAAAHFASWLKKPFGETFSEELARHCENFMYWHPGEMELPKFIDENHEARMTLPAGVFRKKSWCLGLSGMRATIPEDLAYRENSFALDRQKLFSVWHDRHGLLIDGSHAKWQPENSTFAAHVQKHWDYYPIAGKVSAKGDQFGVSAGYKTFTAEVSLRTVSDQELRMEFQADFSAFSGIIWASFTFIRIAKEITGGNGKLWELGENSFEISREDFGDCFIYGAVEVSSASDMRVQWPFKPYETYYSKDHKPAPDAYIVRVAIPLTPKNPRAEVSLRIAS